MKVPEAGPRTALSQGRRIAGGRSDGAGFAAHVSAPSGGAAGISTLSPLAALGTVLAAQEAQDGPGARRRAIRRGRSMRDELDQLRVSPLDGALTEATIERLAGLLEDERPAIEDTSLDAVLHEIELRAAVELAKRRRP
jgi:Class II flagellar assembly regulator